MAISVRLSPWPPPEVKLAAAEATAGMTAELMGRTGGWGLGTGIGLTIRRFFASGSSSFIELLRGVPIVTMAEVFDC